VNLRDFRGIAEAAIRIVRGGSLVLPAVCAALFLSSCQPSSHLPERKQAAGETARADMASLMALRIPEKALEARGLKTEWAILAPAGRLRSAYVVGDDIYAVARPKSKANPHHRLIAYKRGDGTSRWIKTLDTKLTHAPTVYQYPPAADRKPTEVFITQGDRVLCLEHRNGLALWEARPKYSISSPIVVSDSHYFAGSFSGKIYGHQKRSNIEDWAYITEGGVQSAGVYSNLYVFFTSTDATAYRFHGVNGPQYANFHNEGRFLTGASVYGSPTAHGGKVFIGSSDFKLYCLYERDFSMAWDFHAEAPIEKAPIVRDFRLRRGFTTVVLVRSDDSRPRVKRSTLWAVNAADGSRLWRYDHVSHVVATSRKAIYVTTDPRTGRSRRLVSLDPSTGEENFALPIDDFDLVPSSAMGPDTKYRARIFLVNKATGFIQALGERT